ncbi:MAG: alpha/beta hydrolase [Polaromonas sp.]|uniref:alpha/beta hydrolase n=1 Tax=Polaromonas sp. TaxID=1869339 RepID=UPI0017EB38D5|nr:alpha/beta hydrolase [Polaromonas sp.]NMM10887.1 alpha/beta hydrolase [Polaromonas sp.]
MKSTEPVWDTQWLDRMYNNRALVPDYAEHFTRWTRESESERKGLPCHLDVPYGHNVGETLDIFPPNGFSAGAAAPVKPGAPVLVFIHGGYWRSLGKVDHSFLAPHLTQAGACVVMPDYALCPAVTIPEIVLQMVEALVWTWRHIADYGGDPQRITVAGHSAGGHLAAMLLACDWKEHAPDLPPDLVKKALSISGLYDLEPLRHTPFLQNLKLTPEHVQQASPASLSRPGQGTLHSVVGADESDEFLRQNLLIRQAWGSKTVPVCESLPGLNHFSVLEALTEPSHRLNQLTLELLGLGPQPR